jgi:hypothetical protein
MLTFTLCIEIVVSRLDDVRDALPSSECGCVMVCTHRGDGICGTTSGDTCAAVQPACSVGDFTHLCSTLEAELLSTRWKVQATYNMLIELSAGYAQ